MTSAVKRIFAGMNPCAEADMHCVVARPYLLRQLLLDLHHGVQTQDATQGATQGVSQKSLSGPPASPAACVACSTGKQRCEGKLMSRPLQTASASHVPTNRGMQQAHQGLAHFCCCSWGEPQCRRYSATAPPHLPLLLRVGCQEQKAAGCHALPTSAAAQGKPQRAR